MATITIDVNDPLIGNRQNLKPYDASTGGEITDLNTMDSEHFQDEDSVSLEEGDHTNSDQRFDKDGVSTSNQTNSETELARAETLALRRSKIAVVALLSATAILAAVLAFYFARKAENTEFEHQVS